MKTNSGFIVSIIAGIAALLYFLSKSGTSLFGGPSGNALASTTGPFGSASGVLTPVTVAVKAISTLFAFGDQSNAPATQVITPTFTGSSASTFSGPAADNPYIVTGPQAGSASALQYNATTPGYVSPFATQLAGSNYANTIDPTGGSEYSLGGLTDPAYS